MAGHGPTQWTDPMDLSVCAVPEGTWPSRIDPIDASNTARPRETEVHAGRIKSSSDYRGNRGAISRQSNHYLAKDGSNPAYSMVEQAEGPGSSREEQKPTSRQCRSAPT